MRVCIASGSLSVIEWCTSALRLQPAASGMGLRPEDVDGAHVVYPSSEPLRPELAAVAARVTEITLELPEGADPIALSPEQVQAAAAGWLARQKSELDEVRSGKLAQAEALLESIAAGTSGQTQAKQLQALARIQLALVRVVGKHLVR